MPLAVRRPHIILLLLKFSAHLNSESLTNHMHMRGARLRVPESVRVAVRHSHWHSGSPSLPTATATDLASSFSRTLTICRTQTNRRTPLCAFSSLTRSHSNSSPQSQQSRIFNLSRTPSRNRAISIRISKSHRNSTRTRRVTPTIRRCRDRLGRDRVKPSGLFSNVNPRLIAVSISIA